MTLQEYRTRYRDARKEYETELISAIGQQLDILFSIGYDMSGLKICFTGLSDAWIYDFKKIDGE